MVTPSQSLRNLRAHHRVSDRRGVRHWALLVSVFLVDVKMMFIQSIERTLLWSAHQMPDELAATVAAKYRLRDNRW